LARRRAVAAAATALVLAGTAWLLLSGDPDLPRLRSTQASSGGGAPSLPAGSPLPDVGEALARGVRRAAALGGSVEAAVLPGGRREPVVATVPPKGGARWMRMWSMSKIVTMVAVLRALGWRDRPGDALSAEAESALWGAITRSENCRQRRVILELQQASGGSPAVARRAVAAVLRDAGARARLGTEVAPPDVSCVEYLEGQSEIATPLAPALLLGTSLWRISDAVRFVQAVGSGVYGDAVTDFVLAAMRAPKAPSREVAPGELTAPLDWGAGRALAGLVPAYKPGWGGSLQGNFLAGQIAIVNRPSGQEVAVAVMFHPDVQPSTDDPGETQAPLAVELVMRSLREALR
jgi:hypothetical protein